jgi:hypothetical protein
LVVGSIPLVSMVWKWSGEEGGEGERQRQSGGNSPPHCSLTAATDTHDPPPLRTHTDTLTYTHMNLRTRCFDFGLAFRGCGVAAAEERQRGLREEQTGGKASHRRGGGATGDHRA